MIPKSHNLIIAITCFLIGLILLLIGCAPYIPPSTTIPTGVETEAPAGWQDYCDRHPEDEACK